MTTMTEPTRAVTVGIDTHGEVHVAAVLDERGRLLGTESFPTTGAGHRRLESWARAFGSIDAIGVEGTGPIEAIRVLRVARRSAIKARSQAALQLRALVATAPDELRDTLRQLSLDQLVTTAVRWRPGDPTDALAATRVALRSIARRHRDLTSEIKALNQHLDHLVATIAPNLIALHGVGTDCAGQLLVTAGDNPDRLRNEAAFSHLCGASPIPASSGRVIRHRLNRAGDRQANAALYRIVISRLRWHTPTRNYTQRRTTEGLTKPEIIRCLKRFVAREIYHELTHIHP